MSPLTATRSASHADLRWGQARHLDLHRQQRHLAAFRPKSFEPAGGAGAAGERRSAPVPDLGATGGATVTAVHVEETSGPEAR